MDPRDAVGLLRGAPLAVGTPQRWADLGCGTGTFTRALAHLLPPGSVIIAMDRDAAVLDQVPDTLGATRVTKQVGDFVTGGLPATGLDGILLANALHFVSDQPGFIRRATTSLKPAGIFLLVEYDTDTPNPWVPHPLSFATLVELFKGSGFRSVKRLADQPSAFGRARLYSAWAERGGAE